MRGLIWIVFFFSACWPQCDSSSTKQVIDMFNHVYDSYIDNAYPDDELMPLSCKGRKRGRDKDRGDLDHAMGDFSLTLIDTLDTLVVMGDYDRFKAGVKLVIANNRYDADLTVSVFEVTIRALGGLLSAHILAMDLKEKNIFSEYNGELLEHSIDLGERLLLAFDTPHGLPFLRTNLKSGYLNKEDRNTCLACAGSLVLEFSTLARLSQRPEFEEAVHKTMNHLFSQKSQFDLMASLYNIDTGKVVDSDSRIGARCDSYYETLLKSYVLLNDADYYDQFDTIYNGIMKHLHIDHMFHSAYYHNPNVYTSVNFDSLGAFWPGLQILNGNIDDALKSYDVFYQVFKRNGGFIPEAFARTGASTDSHYLLRPEFAESTYMLYTATKSPYFVEIAKEILAGLQKCRVTCGFATLEDIFTLKHEDRMDSYFLAETFKYLYLIFSTHDKSLNFDIIDRYVFNTEAHLLLPLSSYKHEVKHHRPPPSTKKYTCNNTKIKDRFFLNTYLLPKAKLSNMCEIEHELLKLQDKVYTGELTLQDADFFSFLLDCGVNIYEKDGKYQINYVNDFAKSDHAKEIGREIITYLSEISKKREKEAASTSPPTTTLELGDIWLFLPKKVITITGTFGQFIRNFKSLKKKKMMLAAPLNGCEPIPPSNGAVVVIIRGTCSFVQKSLNAFDSGASGVIILNNEKTKKAATMITMTGSTEENQLFPEGFPALLINYEYQKYFQSQEQLDDIRCTIKHKVI